MKEERVRLLHQVGILAFRQLDGFRALLYPFRIDDVQKLPKFAGDCGPHRLWFGTNPFTQVGDGVAHADHHVDQVLLVRLQDDLTRLHDR